MEEQLVVEFCQVSASSFALQAANCQCLKLASVCTRETTSASRTLLCGTLKGCLTALLVHVSERPVYSSACPLPALVATCTPLSLADGRVLTHPCTCRWSAWWTAGAGQSRSRSTQGCRMWRAPTSSWSSGAACPTASAPGSWTPTSPPTAGPLPSPSGRCVFGHVTADCCARGCGFKLDTASLDACSAQLS